MYSGPESTVGKEYSLNMPVLGKKTKTLFFVNSVPKKAGAPPIVVEDRPVGDELAVGIAHSLKVFVAGFRWAILLPVNSTNQQQLPERSNVRAVGVLPGVGIVHSVIVAAVGGA